METVASQTVQNTANLEPTNAAQSLKEATIESGDVALEESSILANI